MGMIQHGDALDLLRTLPSNSVDAIVQDPPYGDLNPADEEDERQIRIPGT